MEDLFKQFRDNLERRPEPEFEERDWQDMQARLERADRDRPAAFAWWWAAVPFMLLLTGSNAFFFWQWKKADKQVSSLEIRRDTVFHTRVVYTTDTIYRTRVLRERRIEYQTSFSQQEDSSRSKMKPGPVLANTPNAEPIGQDRSITLPNVEKKAEKLPEKPATIPDKDRLAQNTNSLPIGEIQPLEYVHPGLNLKGCDVLIPAKKRRLTLSDHLYTARPKGFQIGVSGGLAYPFEKGVDFKYGFSAGLHGAIEFSPKLRLWADATYFKTLFLTDRMGEDIGVPIEAPPSNEYLFLQAEVPQPFIQYSAGMQYLFRSQRKLKPFVGLGLGAISLLTYDVVYEFRNTTLGVEWDLDVPINRKGLITNFLVFPVGLEYRFSRHWNGQIQATYRHNWKESGVQSPSMLGIQGGLNYRF